MKKVIKRIFLGVFALVIFALGAGIIPSYYSLEVSDYEFENEKIQESVKLVQLSDIHNAEFGKENQRLLKKLKECEPDLIFITGDLINSDENEISPMLDLIKKLREIAPIYFSLGNHEIEYEKRTGIDLTEKLEKAGAKVLEEKFVDVTVKGQKFRIGGLYTVYIPEDYEVHEWGNAKEQAEFLKEMEDTERYKILLSHIPNTWMYYDTAATFDLDLIFTGHAHGGQAILPFVGGLYAPDMGYFPGRLSGVYPLTDQDTVEILKRVEEDLSVQNRQEYRSAWHIYLHENEKGEKAEYAEAVLDLCYNLTMEDSIYGISRHYDPEDIESCREWFKSKLKDYWEKDIAPSHVFPAKDSTTWELYQGKLPDWSCAIRILQMKNVQETLELKPALENEKLQTGSRYEVGMEEELKEWDKSIHKGIKRNIIDALIGVVIFVGIELGMNYLQDIVSVEGELSLAATIGWAVLQVIAFGILSSWVSGMISRWWTSCDILDSIEELTRTWADLKIVRKCRERLKVEKG